MYCGYISEEQSQIKALHLSYTQNVVTLVGEGLQHVINNGLNYSPKKLKMEAYIT